MGIIQKMLSKAVAGALGGLLVKESGLSLDNPALIALYPEVFGAASKDKRPPLDHAYKTFAIVYACARIRAVNIAQCPILLYRKGSEDVIEDGPLVWLFQKPNLGMDENELKEGISSYLNISGNAFVWKGEKTQRKGEPLALELLESSRVRRWVTERGEWLGFEYDDGRRQRKIPREQMIHIRMWNPYDPIMGLSPLQAAVLTLDSEWYAMKYNTKFFENDGIPPRTYILPGSTTDQQFDDFKLKVKSETEGISRRHKHQVLRGDIKVQDFGLTQKDMDFLEQRKFTRDEICMIMGVPKAELSLYEDVNYATALSQNRNFWETQLIPEMRKIETAFNLQLLESFGLVCAFDLSKVPALQKLTQEKIDNFVKLVATEKFKANELIRVLDMPFDEEPWRDEESEEEATPEEPSPVARQQEPREPAEKKMLEGLQSERELREAIRTVKWANLRKNISPIERKCGAKIRDYFHNIEVKALRIVTKIWLPADEITIKDFIRPSELDDLFDDAKLERLIEKYLKNAMLVGGESILGAKWKSGSPEAQAALRSRVNKVKVVNETARERVQETIRTIIKTRIEGGLNEEEARKLLEAGLKEDFRQLRGHAKTIARTETSAAYSDARWLAVEETSPSSIEWISSRDDKVRDTHADLDGVVVQWGIPFTTSTGQQLSRPHDPAGAPEEVINCRCDFIAIYSERAFTLERED